MPNQVNIAVSRAATVSALPTASLNTGKMYLVEDPGGNGATSFPADVYSNGTKWKFVGGWALIHSETIEKEMTCPAITWDDTGVFTMTNNGGNTQIQSGGGAHGLATTGRYIPIAGGTNWTAGVWKIISFPNANTIVIDHPYVASLGQPTLALAGTDFIMQRIKIPPLSNSGGVTVNRTYDYGHAATGSTLIKSHLVSDGLGIGSANAFEFYAPAAETTNAPIIRAQFGFVNSGATNVQKSQFTKGDQDGWGPANTGATSTGALETNVTTNIIVIGNIATADDTIKLVSATVRCWL